MQIKQSEIREKINGLLNTANRTDEQDTELQSLTAEAQGLEPELRAALVVEEDAEREAREAAAAGGAVDAETRERLDLRNRATLGGFLLSALQLVSDHGG